MAGFNVPQRLAIATVWESPFGKGKRVLKDVSPVWNRVLGGWTADVIATFSAGNPFIVNAPNNTADPLTNFRANRLCNGWDEFQNKNVRDNGLYWFNSVCFAAPASGYFGNSGTFILTGPGLNNWDIAIGKDAPIRESMKLQFRAELYNVWNHAQFTNPDSTVGDANFGQIVQARDAREIQFGLKFRW